MTVPRVISALRFSRSASLALASSLAACGGSGGGSGGTGPTPDPVATVLVAPPSGLLYIGRTVQLGAAAVDAAGDTLAGRSIAWAATSAEVSVSTTGLVTAHSAGTATVTATSEGKEGSATITVAPQTDVSGTWYFVDSLNDPVDFPPPGFCHDTATLALQQADSTFRGTGVATGTCYPGSRRILNGVVVGNAIAFDFDWCTTAPGVTPNYPFSGTLDAVPPTAAAGSVSCELTSGTWAMTRATP